jgi:hypothetical protein
MAIRRMQETQSPALSLVTIPQNEKDTIVEGLAAVLNSGLSEADSVFNLYCVHDRTSPVMTWQSLIVYVDTSVAWTSAWQNLNAQTGNTYIDNLVNNYGLSIASFTNYSFGSLAEVNTSQILNINALIDSLELEPAITLAEPNAIIGMAGKISYQLIDTVRYYNFRFEFSDCFDGCDNYREWLFAVNPDCSVNYLGFTEFGFFGVQPLPAPANCNLFTSTYPLSEETIKVFPNPVSDVLCINAATDEFYCIRDLFGRIILEGNLKKDNKIDTSNLTPGLYIISIGNNALKFVKM